MHTLLSCLYEYLLTVVPGTRYQIKYLYPAFVQKLGQNWLSTSGEHTRGRNSYREVLQFIHQHKLIFYTPTGTAATVCIITLRTFRSVHMDARTNIHKIYIRSIFRSTGIPGYTHQQASYLCTTDTGDLYLRGLNGRLAPRHDIISCYSIPGSYLYLL